MTVPEKYISIEKCGICANLFQTLYINQKFDSSPDYPKDAAELSLVLEINEETESQYCASTTRLLKCPQCGTYYYYNHYVDDGQHFMDPTSDDVTLRRYTPQAAMRFLEGLAGPLGTLPHTPGQLRKSFLEGSRPAPKYAADSAAIKNTETARREMKALDARYGALMDGLAGAVNDSSIGWHIILYCVESLCGHFLAGGGWEGLKAALLENKNPVVRVEAACHLFSVATGDAPVIEMIHIPGQIRDNYRKIVLEKSNAAETARVLFDAAANDGTILKLDRGYGLPRYYEKPLSFDALDGLVTAAEVTDLSGGIPSVIGLLSGDRSLNYHVCWLLRKFAELKSRNARLVLEGLKAIPAEKSKSLMEDKEFKKMAAECRGKVRKKRKGGKHGPAGKR